MNKKIIIVVSVLLLIIATVTAFEIGQTINQDQLNALDVDSISLGESFARDESNKIIYDCNLRVCSFYVNIITLEETNNSDYIIISKTNAIKVRMDMIKRIKQQQGIEKARELLKNYLVESKERIATVEKLRIKKMQTEQVSEYQTIIDGLVI